MVINARMKHVPSFFFQHAKRSENASTTHLLEDANVHQTVIQGRTWGKREHGAARLTVLHQKKREVVGDDTVVKSKCGRTPSSSENRHEDADVVPDGAHPSHFLCLNG